jgi:hypothetical protein
MAVTGTPVAGVYYNVLVAGQRYLKNIDALATDPQKGLTQEDLNAAQESAKALVDSQLAPCYDLSPWLSEVPPVIEDVAELLSSAQVLEYAYERDSQQGDAIYPKVLREQGLRMLSALKAGHLLVVKADGTVQQMKKGVGKTAPRLKAPETTFFPDESSKTRQNLKTLYQEGNV